VIIGIGLDLIGIERIAAVHQRQGVRFLERIYSPAEQAYCLAHRQPSERLAARWAAKEACMKALGTGWSAGVTFLDIEVRLLPSGAPTLILTGAAALRADRLGMTHSHLTLSHSDGLAVAMVVLESLPTEPSRPAGAA
jgi:holo-[acyl-carrier protein] synthase